MHCVLKQVVSYFKCILNGFNGLNLMKEINTEKLLDVDIQENHIIHILKHMITMMIHYQNNYE